MTKDEAKCVAVMKGEAPVGKVQEALQVLFLSLRTLEDEVLPMQGLEAYVRAHLKNGKCTNTEALADWIDYLDRHRSGNVRVAPPVAV